MKDIDLKATCPYKSDLKCNAAINALCDNKCCYHPRYVDDGLNENYKVHRCPYSENTTCSGEICGNDCCFHPNYDEDSGTDFRNDWGENAYINKKIDRADLDFDFDEDESECGLLKDKKNWKNGIGPCVGCERDCPITADMVEEKEPELTYDNGVVEGMNKLQEWYNEGKRMGYDRGVAEGYEKGQEDMMIECSGGLEDAYLDGYKDRLYGEEPMVEDDELREILSAQPLTPKGRRVNVDAEKVVNGDLYVSGKILCMIENAKEKLYNIRKQIYTSGINSEKEQRNFALELFNVVKMLDDVQHEYTSDALYEYLGYME